MGYITDNAAKTKTVEVVTTDRTAHFDSLDRVEKNVNTAEKAGHI